MRPVDVEVYQNEEGSIALKVPVQWESVWLNANQMSQLFGRDKSVISRHIRNVFQEDELEEGATVAFFATVQKEGGRQVSRQVAHYNLDVVISVGYRVKSRQGVRFRQWATSVLREHLVKGYTVDQKRLAENAGELSKALELVRRSAGTIQHLEEGRGLVDVISRYTQTFLWLQQYDEGRLAEPEGQRGGWLMPLDEAQSALRELKTQLMDKGEATTLFAMDKGSGLASIWGALGQSAFGEDVYPSVESKAAHLLYFVVKNHPFTDGNKRSAAFLLICFLNGNGRLFNEKGEPIINEAGLAALTLLVAESDPKEKDTVIRLILNLLAQG
jgi:prophage maintenance system killer protein